MFERSDILKLTGLTYNQLRYLIEKGFIDVDIENGKSTHFDFEDLLVIKFIAKIRKICSMQELSLLKDEFQKCRMAFHDYFLNDMMLFIIGKEFYFVERDKLKPFIESYANQMMGCTIRLIMPIQDLINELLESAYENNMNLEWKVNDKEFSLERYVSN